MGSKARVSKEVSKIINKTIQELKTNIYIEPFVGGANMIEHIECEIKYGYDTNNYLIEFFKALQQKWNPLDNIDMTKELYNDIKDNKDKYQPCIVALAGFCATYNAKWFGGYAGIVKTKIGTERNYYNEAVRNVLKQINKLKDVKFETKNYNDLDMHNAVIYCDPPYEGTTKYKDDFNHQEYWEWVRERSKDNMVFCSEYNAPDDFICIWSKELTTTLDKSSRKKDIERLFIHSSIYKKYILKNVEITTSKI
jgi:DNA adenine methylase